MICAVSFGGKFVEKEELAGDWPDGNGRAGNWEEASDSTVGIEGGPLFQTLCLFLFCGTVDGEEGGVSGGESDEGAAEGPTHPRRNPFRRLHRSVV
ncbi:hypothetical protein Tco_0720405 [Tanacetum coccineum]